MVKGANISCRVVKAIVVAIALMVSFALAPDALAHGSADTSVRYTGASAIQPHPAPVTVSAVDKEATAYLQSTGWKEGGSDASDAPDPSPGRCHDGCCCKMVTSCASCCGAVISPEIRVFFFLPIAELSFPADRTTPGLPPIPADPPPRAPL